MPDKLVIVESPAKAKTIGRYLGKNYEVTASKGHVRDLPESNLGLNPDTFEPTYEVLKGKEKVVQELAKKSKGKKVFLASDLDREGEAIAWHISELLGLPRNEKNRIVFNEITESAIKSAILDPREIDMSKVEAQVARRVLDRIVGYKISPILWRTMTKGLSAGRVQSVALKFMVELEKRIAVFVPHKFFKIFAQVGEDRFSLSKIDGKKFNNKSITSEEKRDEIINELSKANLHVKDVRKRTSKRNAPMPFITSTLQQSAIGELGWSASKTMKIAQQLYEGIETDNGQMAFITYMRTDSTRISSVAREKVVEIINSKFGKEYIGPVRSAGKGKKIQDAHEAIRPTYPENDPDTAKKLLSGDNLRLYTLIWNRFIASQMASAEYAVTDVQLEDENEKYILSLTGERRLFDGFERIISRSSKSEIGRDYKKGEEIKPSKIEFEEDTTKPPSRFSEASLVKELEKRGIGRPSTYATIISTLLDRKYVLRQSRELRPTLLGSIVNEFLNDYFPDVVDTNFTANMEEELDDVENGAKKWQDVVQSFYGGFKTDLDQIDKKIKKGELRIEFLTDKECSCGGYFKIVFGRYGGYLKCRSCEKNESVDMTSFTCVIDGKVLLKDVAANQKIEVEIDEKCPECGSVLVKRKGRYGEFIACSAYPKCKYTRNVRIDAACPKCGGVVEKLRSKKGKNYFKCSECGELYWNEPTKEKCEICDSHLFLKIKRGGKRVHYCEKCKKEFEVEEGS
ncbi:MAG: type I DNA topoisomerase [Kosmotogaceae bacterium]